MAPAGPGLAAGSRSAKFKRASASSMISGMVIEPMNPNIRARASASGNGGRLAISITPLR